MQSILKYTIYKFLCDIFFFTKSPTVFSSYRVCELLDCWLACLTDMAVVRAHNTLIKVKMPLITKC